MPARSSKSAILLHSNPMAMVRYSSPQQTEPTDRPEALLAFPTQGIGEKQRVIEYVCRIVGDEADARRIVDALQIERAKEVDVIRRAIDKLTHLCTGVDPQHALEAMWWWLYSEAEQGGHLEQCDVVAKIASIGHFLAKRSAFSDEWYATIQPLEETTVPEERRTILAQEFNAGKANVRPRLPALKIGLTT